MARSINKSILDDKQMLVDYLRSLEQTISSLQKEVDDLKSTPSTGSSIVDTKSLGTIKSALQSGGTYPLNVTGLIGRLNEPQFARVPLLTAHPDPLVVTYDLYVLSGAPNTLWGINRMVNPPVKFQIG